MSVSRVTVRIDGVDVRYVPSGDTATPALPLPPWPVVDTSTADGDLRAKLQAVVIKDFDSPGGVVYRILVDAYMSSEGPRRIWRPEGEPRPKRADRRCVAEMVMEWYPLTLAAELKPLAHRLCLIYGLIRLGQKGLGIYVPPLSTGDPPVFTHRLATASAVLKALHDGENKELAEIESGLRNDGSRTLDTID